MSRQDEKSVRVYWVIIILAITALIVKCSGTQVEVNSLGSSSMYFHMPAKIVEVLACKELVDVYSTDYVCDLTVANYAGAEYPVWSSFLDIYPKVGDTLFSDCMWLETSDNASCSVNLHYGYTPMYNQSYEELQYALEGN